MKKLLLILITTLVFGSALANIGSIPITSNTSEKLIDIELVNDFVLTKANVNYGSLKIKNDVLTVSYACENNCLASFQNCQAAGFSWCFRALSQCIDTCEGAGGLYN